MRLQDEQVWAERKEDDATTGSMYLYITDATGGRTKRNHKPLPIDIPHPIA